MMLNEEIVSTTRFDVITFEQIKAVTCDLLSDTTIRYELFL